jgi:uncharacterized protein (TIGR02266 family)
MFSTPKRAANRSLVRVQVNYTHEGCYLISFSRDVSADGIYVCTDDPAPVGTRLRLVFPFPNHQEVSCAARVVWSDSDGRTGQRGMGLQFLDPPPPFQEVILDLLNRIAILGSDLGASGNNCGTA